MAVRFVATVMMAALLAASSAAFAQRPTLATPIEALSVMPARSLTNASPTASRRGPGRRLHPFRRRRRPPCTAFTRERD